MSSSSSSSSSFTSTKEAATQALLSSVNSVISPIASSSSSSRGGRPVGTKLTKANAGNSSTINELKSSITKQKGFSSMLTYGIECFKKLGTSEVSVEEIIENGSIECLFEAVQQHLPGNKKVIEAFLSMISSFCKNSRLARMIGDRIGNKWNWLTDCIKTNLGDSSFLTNVASAVSALSLDPTNVDQMARDGVFDALGIAVQRSPLSVELGTAVAGALTTFSGRSKNYAESLVSNPSIPLLIALMSNNTNNLPLCQNVSSLIENLALSGKNACDELKKMFAVDSLLGAVECHPYDEKLLKSATGALKLLTGANDMSICLGVLVGNVSMDGNFASAMNKLAGLLLVPDNVDFLFKNKGVEWLIAVLVAANKSDDPNAPKILQSGCLALKRCAIDPNKIYEIIRCKGVPTLISIINDHAKQPDIVAAALGALGKLVGGNKDNAKYLLQNNAIPVALKAIERNPLVPQIVRPAMDLLSSLTQFNDEMFNDPIRRAQGIPLLCKVIEQYMDTNKPIATLALNVLGKLSEDPETLDELMNQSILPRNLMKILEDNDDDLDLAKAALLALEALSNAPGGVPKLLSLNGIGCISGVLNRFDDDELNAIAGKIIAKLQNDDKAKKAAEFGRLQRLQQQKDAEELERKNLELEMLKALEAMKGDEDREKERKEREWKEEERQKRLKDDEDKAKAAANAARNSQIKTINVGNLAPSSPKAIVMTKSAKKIFADDDRKKGPAVLSDETRQFLVSGQLLIKHSKTAAPRQRHVYLSPDLSHLNWKDPKGDLKLKNRMKVFKLFNVVKGATTPQLQRTTMLGKSLAKEECSFSIFGSDVDTEQERTVDLEARTEGEAGRWVAAIEELIEWAKAKKLWGADTMAVQEDKNKLYAKHKAAHVVL